MRKKLTEAEIGQVGFANKISAPSEVFAPIDSNSLSLCIYNEIKQIATSFSTRRKPFENNLDKNCQVRTVSEFVAVEVEIVNAVEMLASFFLLTNHCIL